MTRTYRSLALISCLTLACTCFAQEGILIVSDHSDLDLRSLKAQLEYYDDFSKLVSENSLVRREIRGRTYLWSKEVFDEERLLKSKELLKIYADGGFREGSVQPLDEVLPLIRNTLGVSVARHGVTEADLVSADSVLGLTKEVILKREDGMIVSIRVPVKNPLEYDELKPVEVTGSAVGNSSPERMLEDFLSPIDGIKYVRFRESRSVISTRRLLSDFYDYVAEVGDRLESEIWQLSALVDSKLNEDFKRLPIAQRLTDAESRLLRDRFENRYKNLRFDDFEIMDVRNTPYVGLKFVGKQNGNITPISATMIQFDWSPRQSSSNSQLPPWSSN